MSSFVYKFLSSYFNKYFKNIEHLDLSLKDSKIKIDSIVPHSELFTKLLNLDQLNLKIESGLLKDLVLEFPLNIVNNHIRISCRTFDIYVSDDSEKDNKNNNINNENDLIKASSPRSDKDTLSNHSEETFWDRVKDDIVANLIIKIDKINIYYFNKKSIIKFEVYDCLFSPSELTHIENPLIFNSADFELIEALIKNSKKQNTSFRKCLKFNKIQASLQESLKENDNQNKYFLKNFKLVINMDFYNGENINENFFLQNIIIDNFLFDYDIFEFYKLYDLIFHFINRNLNITTQDNRERSENVTHKSETYIHLQNSNINFYHNCNEEILFYFVLDNLTFKLINNPKVSNQINYDFYFNKIFLFIPLINTNLKNASASNFLKVIIKNLESEGSNNSSFLNKKFSIDLKMTLGKEKVKFLSDLIYITLNANKTFNENIKINLIELITNFKIVTSNIIFKFDLRYYNILFSSIMNLKKVMISNFYNYFNSKKIKEESIIKKGLKEYIIKEDINQIEEIVTSNIISNDIITNNQIISIKVSNKYLLQFKMPNFYFEIGKNENFNDWATFNTYLSCNLYSTKIDSSIIIGEDYDFNSTNMNMIMNSTLNIQITNLLTHKIINLIDDLVINLTFSPSTSIVNNEQSNNSFNLNLSNVNINIDAYIINFLNNLKDFFNNQQIFDVFDVRINSQSSNSISSDSSNNTDLEYNSTNLHTISNIKNCTSYVFEVLYFRDNLINILKPNNEKEISHKDFKLRFSINDTIFENNFDISQILLSIFTTEVYSDSSSSENGFMKKEVIDFTKIILINKENNIRLFNLFFQYDSSNKNKINLFIFDNVILINNFPSPTNSNILKYITSKSSEISSVDKFYHENYLQNIYLSDRLKSGFKLPSNLNTNSEFSVPILSFICDNILFINFFGNDVEIEVNYLDKKEIIMIPPKEEKSIMIIPENLISINFVLKYSSKLKQSAQSVLYYSEDIKNLLIEERSSSPITFNSTKMMQKTKSSLIHNNSLNINYTVEDFNNSSMFYSSDKTKNLIDKVGTHNGNQAKMKIIKILPNLVIRNFTTCKDFNIYFMINNSCDKVNYKFENENINTPTTNNNSPLYELENNLYEISKGESIFLLNENTETNSKFSINKIKFGFKFTEEWMENNFYFSDIIRLDNNSSKKDYLICIKTLENLYFIFRMKLKYFNDNVVSITISSFNNFSIKNSPEIDNIIIKNKNDCLNSNLNNIMNFSQIDRNSDINFDTLYNIPKGEYSKNKSFIVEINDVLSFVELIKNLENNLEIYINNDYLAPINLKNLFTSDNYQLNANNSLNFLNKLKNRIFHVRILHHPIFICEIFSQPINVSKNTYLFVENKTKIKFEFYIKTIRNSEIMRFICQPESINDFVLFSDIETLLIPSNEDEEVKSDLHLVRFGNIIDERTINKECYVRGLNIKIRNKLNNYIVTINNKADLESIPLLLTNNNITNTKVSVTISDFNLNLSLLPFFITRNTSSHNSTESFANNFCLKIKKILGNYIYNNLDSTGNSDSPNKQMINFSLADFELFYYTKNNLFSNNEDSIQHIIKTKYLTDFRLEIEKIIIYSSESNLECNKNFDRNRNRSIDFLTMKINCPFETQISIEDSLLHSARFFLIQLSNGNNNNNNNISKTYSRDSKILSMLSLPKIDAVYNFNLISINDFTLTFNVEYKKGLSFTVKNSKIINKKSEIKNLSGNTNQILQEIKNNFMKNFFTNLYNLFKSTELFGNFNGLLDQIKRGFKKFKENPFTTGIFSLFYASLKGSIDSVYGIGKSLSKSIKNIKSSNFDYLIYKNYNDILKEVLLNSKSNNLNLVILDVQKYLEYNNTKIQISQFYNKLNSIEEKLDKTSLDISSYFSDDYSKFYRQSFITSIFTHLNDSDKEEYYKIKNTLLCKKKDELYLIVLTNYFFCICNKNVNSSNIKIEYLIPFVEISEMSPFKTRNRVVIMLKNGSVFEFNFINKNHMRFFKFEIIDKFE